MGNILGTDFTVSEISVLEPPPPPPPKNPPKQDDDDDENIDEISIKTREEILEDLKKKGVKDKNTKEENAPDKYDIGDKQKSDDEGTEKPKDEGTDDGTDEGTEKPKDEGTDEVTDEGTEKPDDEGTDEGTEKPESPDGNLTDRQKKQKAKEEAEREKRKIKEAKNIVTEKINSYNTFLEKYSDVIPNKEKVFVQKKVNELKELHKSIKTD